ncbi:MAG: undecaprenyl-phosphate glucose phosphotransferase [Planctomycetota bacterium]
MRSLRRYSATWLKVPFDLGLTTLSLLAAYWLALEGIPRELSKGVPPLSIYLPTLPVILAVLLLTALYFRLYRPRRTGSYGQLLVDLLKVNGQTIVIILALAFCFRQFSYSRLIMINFIILNPMLLFLHHYLWLARERRLFRKGIGTRSCLLVGCGTLARSMATRIEKHPWTGLRIHGFLETGANEPALVPSERILGGMEDLENIIEQHHVQEVIVAVPFRAMNIVAETDQRLSRTTVGLRWVPDLEALNTLSREFSNLDGFHVINLRGIRDYGVNAFMKRSLDIAASALLLIVTAPVMGTIAFMVRISSGRPILFRQERMGLDGRVFSMLKFRTMKTHAERESGPVFADAEDPRCTRVGAVLRRHNLDELPQLWNVLQGEMSLVGPRPERPHFIDEFKNTIPSYMLRHRMKAGVTGWAQVNGWRGKTSLHKRIQCDLYYLKNWSLWLDLKILLLTLLYQKRPPNIPKGLQRATENLE